MTVLAAVPSARPAGTGTDLSTAGRTGGPQAVGTDLAASALGMSSVAYQPILDIERGTTAGYQAVSGADLVHELHPPAGSDLDRLARQTARTATAALSAAPTLPTNTFMTVPMPYPVLAHPDVRETLEQHGSLAGVVLDITGFSSDPAADAQVVLAECRDRGALVAVGGDGMPQPELTSIVRLKPSFVRLGRAWVRGLDTSEAKRSAIEVTGRLAGQLDAWVVAEGVSSAAELRALCGLGVPLAQGPFIGAPQTFWPEIDLSARTSLPTITSRTDGVLRGLVQHAYTARDAAAAAAVLPETTGFDLLVVVDEWKRPTSVFECEPDGTWTAAEALAVNIDTPLADAVARAMARPRAVRFTPLSCTDNAGRFVGVLRIERLVEHLAQTHTG